MNLTLGDLLGQRDLGLELLTPDTGALERPIGGAHSIEIAVPSRWLPPDWIMLTNGLRVRGRRDEQRQLVAELAEGGQAALGWAVGTILQRVPRAVLDEARARDFPVFLVPIETPFREIVSFVNGARLSDDLFVMRRAMSMQDYLMDALGVDDPQAAIIERLATMLDADAVLLDADGGTLAAHGAVPADEVAAAVLADGGAATTGEVVVRGRRTLALPVVADERRAAWIALVLPAHREMLDRIAKPVLRSAAQLAGLVAHAQQIHVGERRAKRAELLADALDGTSPEHAVGLDEQARELRVDFEAPAHVVAWSRRTGEPPLERALADELVHALEEELDAAGLPFLLAAREGWIAGVVQGEVGEATEHLLPGRLREVGVSAGIGRAIGSLGEARQSAVDARVALQHALHERGPCVVHELDPASWLLASCDQRTAIARVAGILEPLRAHPALLATLWCYFDSNLNVAQAALRLDLHRNTLRYRLSRIEDLLDMRLDAPRTITNLYMALLSERLADPGPTATGDDGPGGGANGDGAPGEPVRAASSPG